jgi:hypothetical protein
VGTAIKIQSLAFLIEAALYLLLIPLAGVYGVAISHLAGYMIMLSLTFFAVNTFFPFKRVVYFKQAVRMSILAFAVIILSLAGEIIFRNQSSVSFIYRSLIFSLIFPGFLYLGGYLSRGELRQFEGVNLGSAFLDPIKHKMILLVDSYFSLLDKISPLFRKVNR